jgi:hypothetical protein
MRMPKFLICRLIWFTGSITVLLSFYLQYTNQISLIAIIHGKILQMFDIANNLSSTNLIAIVAVIGFILVLLGGVFSLVFSMFAYRGSKLWNAPMGIKIWNASWLSLVGIVLMCSPIFVYQNGTLIQVISIIDLQYWPTLEGVDIGFIFTWIGVVLSLISGKLVLRYKPPY